MNILVTGGAGFIGSHLVDQLLEEGHRVTVIDRLSRGDKNIRQHMGNPLFKLIKMDIKDYDALEPAVEGHDVIFHFAANADIRHGLKNTRRDLDENIYATYNLLEAARHTGIKKFVFASSAAVYGEPDVFPTPEDYFPVQTSLYGASKLAAEGLIEAFCEGFGMQTWIFRFVSVVGERHPHGVTYDFVCKLQKNPKELEILGNGRQRKSFLYVKDCVDGILFGFRHAKEKVNIFNLGVEQYITVKDVADIVTDEMGLTDVKYHFTGGERGWVGDAPFVWLSIERIKKLGWKPKVDIEEGIRRTVRWLLAHPHYYGGEK